MAAGNKRIALVAPGVPFRGGIAHHAAMLFKALERHHDPTLIGFRRQYPALFFPGKTQLDESHVTFAIDAERILDPLNPLSWWTAFRRIKRQDPRVLVFEWWHPSFGLCYGVLTVLVRLFSRQRIVFICHNLLPHERHFADRLLTRFALAGAHRVVCHAEHLREQALRWMPNKDIVVRPHPLYDQFRLSELTQSEARARLGVSGNVLLFFGYVRAYKGLGHLLEALPMVLSELDVTLIVAGEFYDAKQPYLEQIERLGIESNVMLVDRYVPNDEVEVYFAACDLVVCPYVRASQSGIVPAAYGFSKPVVCTDAGGLPEAVIDGETGIVVDAADAGALARGILAYYRCADREAYARAITQLNRSLGWDRLVQAIVDV